jgi:hypothetical protein
MIQVGTKFPYYGPGSRHEKNEDGYVIDGNEILFIHGNYCFCKTIDGGYGAQSLDDVKARLERYGTNVKR